MTTIWVCPHVMSGTTPRRLTNLENFVHLDCGAQEHFDDLRQFRATSPAYAGHFGQQIADAAARLPVNCVVKDVDYPDNIDVFAAEEFQPSNYCSLAFTMSRAKLRWPQLFKNSSFYSFIDRDGHLAIVKGAGGLRSFPIWALRADAEAVQTEWFFNDEIKQYERDDLPELFRALKRTKIDFLNIDFCKFSWDEVVMASQLADEILKEC